MRSKLLTTALLVATGLVAQSSSAFSSDVEGLSKVLATSQRAGEQGSPLDAVDEGLKLLELQKGDVLLDPGCGDGRVIVSAVVQYGCRGLGIEIDAQQADLARKTAVQRSVEKRSLVLLGDFTKYDFTELGATKAYVYLYPETLGKIAPELKKLKRVVSYMHDVPGLKTTRVGDFYVWDRDRPVAVAPVVAQASKLKEAQQVTKVVEGQRYAVWGGRTYYTEYNPGCNCSMCASIRYQLSIPRTTTVVEPVGQEPKPEKKQVEVSQLPTIKLEQPTGHWWYGCMNGKCGWHWVK